MIFEILTLFPEMFDSFLNTSILGRAIAGKKIQVRCHNIRDYATGKHRVTDEPPYGGGSGMVMKPEPIVRAIREMKKGEPSAHVVLLSPQGRPFKQDTAAVLARRPRLVLVCGRYEGVDERVRDLGVDEEISVGDFILTGGELAAMVLVDATARLLPGVLGDEQSPKDDTFSKGLLEYPQYTRPREYMDLQVPGILLSGDHEKIHNWRRRKALERTLLKRPEMLDKANLSDEDRAYLGTLQESQEQAGPGWERNE